MHCVTFPRWAYWTLGAAVCIIIALVIIGCAPRATLYVPPPGCVQSEDGGYGSILMKITDGDPRQADLLLRVVHAEFVDRASLYSVARAREIIAEARVLVAQPVTLGSLASWLVSRLHVLDMRTASLLVASQLVEQFLGVDDIISPCDRALLLRHLDHQDAMLASMRVGREG